MIGCRPALRPQRRADRGQGQCGTWGDCDASEESLAKGLRLGVALAVQRAIAPVPERVQRQSVGAWDAAEVPGAVAEVQHSAVEDVLLDAAKVVPPVLSVALPVAARHVPVRGLALRAAVVQWRRRTGSCT